MYAFGVFGTGTGQHIQKVYTMVRKIVFVMLLALQFSVVANMASAYSWPCNPCSWLR